MTDTKRIEGLEASFFSNTDYIERAASYDQLADERHSARHTRRVQRGIFSLVLLVGLCFAAWLEQVPDPRQSEVAPAAIAVTMAETVEMSPKLLAVLDLNASRRNINRR